MSPEGSSSLAGFWARFLARVLDVVILFIPVIVFSAIFPVLGGIILGLLYWPILDSSVAKGTLGKYFMGIAVVDESGNQVTFKRALSRYILSWASGLLFCLGYFFYFFTSKRQTFHDLIAGTLVINLDRKSDIDWWETWLSQFHQAIGEFRVQKNLTESNQKNADAGTRQNENWMAELEKLHELYRKGVISDSEFQEKKRQILSQSSQN